MNNSYSWEEIKNSLKPGTKLEGVVTHHFGFGIFVVLPGIEFTGLVTLPDFKDEGNVTRCDYPAIGSSVNVVVLAFKEMGQHIWLSMRPSLLNKSSEAELFYQKII